MGPVKPPRPKLKLYGLVRGADGAPKIDDPKALHPLQVAMLTKEERSALGLTKGERDGRNS